MTSPSRWRVSHLIVIDDSTGDDFRGFVYANVVCGARVKLGRLEPEPTGVDTIDRCAGCRRWAYKYGADAES